MCKKIIYFSFNIILLIASVIILFFAGVINKMPFKVIICVLLIALLLISIILLQLGYKSISRLFYVLFVVGAISVIIYGILYLTNILYIFTSISTLREYILSTGKYGVIIYILIQLMQVIFLPIPASIICIVGSLIYGPILCGLYCSIGVLIGSFISFLIGKFFGYKIVTWIVGKSNTEKYSKIIVKRGWFFLGLAFLLPMFPDDILCLIAGITNMSFKSFFWTTIITRPIGVICMAIFGSGYVIPFSGWGIYVWAIILVIAVLMVYVTYRYQDELENFVLNKIFKKHKNK